MKIKEKIKTFVEENKSEIKDTLICVGLGAGTALIGFAGFVIGRKFTLGEFEYNTNIDFARDLVCVAEKRILKDVCNDGVTDALKHCGFESLDDTAKVALLIQK